MTKTKKNNSLLQQLFLGVLIVVFASVGMLLLRSSSAAPGDPLTNENLDLNGDGSIGIVDLSQLLSQWNSPGAADFNGDGTVNIVDMSLLLAQWGHIEGQDPVDPPVANNSFFDDFTVGDWQDRYDVNVFHRDWGIDYGQTWEGDHQSTGPNDLCNSPDNKRVINLGEKVSRNGYSLDDFNDEWIYRCVPGGDLAKAHLMTSIGDVNGYSIGAFAPKQTFEGITEVRWDVNQTDLGDRQWTEVAVIPEQNFDLLNLPCQDGLPCGTQSHTEAGSVGTQWGGLRSRFIITAEEPGGYQMATGWPYYRCGGSSCGEYVGTDDGGTRIGGATFGGTYGIDDPALLSIRTRRNNFFRDNQNGTLTWGFQLEDGSYSELTVPGSFPDGPVRVVFKDHSYTPLKSPATLLPETTFTWHWDNISIE